MERFRFSAVQCVKDIYRTEGIRGFYRGLSASYAGQSVSVWHCVHLSALSVCQLAIELFDLGITETALYFIIYEHLKSEMRMSSYIDNTRHWPRLKGTQQPADIAEATCNQSTALYTYSLVYPSLSF